MSNLFVSLIARAYAIWQTLVATTPATPATPVVSGLLWPEEDANTGSVFF